MGMNVMLRHGAYVLLGAVASCAPPRQPQLVNALAGRWYMPA